MNVKEDKRYYTDVRRQKKKRTCEMGKKGQKERGEGNIKN